MVGGLGFTNLEDAKEKKEPYAFKTIWQLTKKGWVKTSQPMMRARYLHGVTVVNQTSANWGDSLDCCKRDNIASCRGA